jgi:simple sugar transport system permease protein/ribose transport system permease protein
METPGQASVVATQPLTKRRLSSPRWFQALGTAQGTFVALLLLCIFNAIFTTNFLSWTTWRVNLTQVSTIVIVGVGMTIVIATGGIDLSVGSLMAISGALAPMIFLSDRWPFHIHWIGIVFAIVIPILVAGCFGLFNGMLVARFGIQPIIATLVLYLGGRGIAQVITDGKLREFRNPDFQVIGQGRPLSIPVQVILMIIIVAVASWAMSSTTFGRYVLASGGNESAARLAGVPVARIKYAVYGLSGLLAGLAGLIVIAINSSSDPNLVGQNMELDAIAAAAVGGTALMGGRATIVGTIIGAILIQQLRYTLLSHGVSDASTRIVTAVAIVVAVLLQRQRAS